MKRSVGLWTLLTVGAVSSAHAQPLGGQNVGVASKQKLVALAVDRTSYVGGLDVRPVATLRVDKAAASGCEYRWRLWQDGAPGALKWDWKTFGAPYWSSSTEGKIYFAFDKLADGDYRLEVSPTVESKNCEGLVAAKFAVRATIARSPQLLAAAANATGFAGAAPEDLTVEPGKMWSLKLFGKSETSCGLSVELKHRLTGVVADRITLSVPLPQGILGGTQDWDVGTYDVTVTPTIDPVTQAPACGGTAKATELVVGAKSSFVTPTSAFAAPTIKHMLIRAPDAYRIGSVPALPRALFGGTWNGVWLSAAVDARPTCVAKLTIRLPNGKQHVVDEFAAFPQYVASAPLGKQVAGFDGQPLPDGAVTFTLAPATVPFKTFAGLPCVNTISGTLSFTSDNRPVIVPGATHSYVCTHQRSTSTETCTGFVRPRVVGSGGCTVRATVGAASADLLIGGGQTMAMSFPFPQTFKTPKERNEYLAKPTTVRVAPSPLMKAPAPTCQGEALELIRFASP